MGNKSSGIAVVPQCMILLIWAMQGTELNVRAEVDESVIVI